MNQPEPRMVFATDIFIREMKRQWIRQHSSVNPALCPVKPLESYPAQHRLALATAIAKAVEASTGMDEAYAAWIKSKTEQQPV
ncbi:MAG: hypothetical protein Q7T25_09460 [Sideroxyarcus sp.]|nr:hypothetical protein [Sideroxyarcus sp.]